MADSTSLKRKTPPKREASESERKKPSTSPRILMEKKKVTNDIRVTTAPEPPHATESTREPPTSVTSTTNLASHVLLRTDILPDAIQNHQRLLRAGAWAAQSANAVNEHFDNAEWDYIVLQFRHAYFYLGQGPRESPKKHRIVRRVLTKRSIPNKSAARPLYFLINSLYPRHPDLSQFNKILEAEWRSINMAGPPPVDHMPEPLSLIRCNVQPVVSNRALALLEQVDGTLPLFLIPDDVRRLKGAEQPMEGNATGPNNQTGTVSADQNGNHAGAASPGLEDLDSLFGLTAQRHGREAPVPQPPELFPSSNRFTWQDVAKWASERHLPVASALVHAGLDPRSFSYRHLANDQPYFDADKEKWDAIFARFDKNPRRSNAGASRDGQPVGEGCESDLRVTQPRVDQGLHIPTADIQPGNCTIPADILATATDGSTKPQPGTAQEQMGQYGTSPSTGSTSQSPLVKLVELLQVMGEGSGGNRANNHGAWKVQLAQLAALQEKSAEERIEISNDLIRTYDRLTALTKRKREADLRDKSVNSLLQQIITTGEGTAVCAMLEGSDLGKVQADLKALEKQFEHKGYD
jgi:hypothetical protein